MGSTCTCFNSSDKLTSETNIFSNNTGKNIININFIKIKIQKLIMIQL